MNLIKFFGYILIIFSTLSGFMYCAFDFQWWAPFSGGDVNSSTRALGLIIFHVFSVSIGICLID